MDRTAQRALFERHDRAVVSIRLPLAPTMNLYWRSRIVPASQGARVITYVSNEGKKYKKDVAAAWVAHWKGWPPEPLTGRLRLLISVSYYQDRNIDLDNRVKPLQDALTDCKAWGDDDQIDDLRVIRGPNGPKPGYMDVTIETISE